MIFLANLKGKWSEHKLVVFDYSITSTLIFGGCMNLDSIQCLIEKKSVRQRESCNATLFLYLCGKPVRSQIIYKFEVFRCLFFRLLTAYQVKGKKSPTCTLTISYSFIRYINFKSSRDKQKRHDLQARSER